MPLHLCQLGNKTMSPGVNHRCCSLKSPVGKAINRHGPVGWHKAHFISRENLKIKDDWFFKGVFT